MERQESRRRIFQRRYGERMGSTEPERTSPRGKQFAMINSGHSAQNVPHLEMWRQRVEETLATTSPEKKVLLFIEAGTNPSADSQRIGELVEQGMRLSDAEAQLVAEQKRMKSAAGRRVNPEIRGRLRDEIMGNKEEYDRAVTNHVDSLIDAHPGRIVVLLEGQPDYIVNENVKFIEEIEAPLPEGVRMGRLVAERREMLEHWAETKRLRESKSARDITDEMSRTDIVAGVGLQGAWHHAGIDTRLRESLRLEDDPEARNIQSIFPESQMPTQEHGKILYPVNPQLDLLRRMIDGEKISDLEIQIALEAEKIDFTRTTAEEAIRDQLSPKADPHLSDLNAETQAIPGVYPEGRAPDYYREQQRYVRLRLGMVEGTQQLPSVRRDKPEGTASLGQEQPEVRAEVFDGSAASFAALPDSTRMIMTSLLPGGGDDKKLLFATDEERRALHEKAQNIIAEGLARKEELRRQGVPEDELPEGTRVKVVFNRSRAERAAGVIRAKEAAPPASQEPSLGSSESITDQESGYPHEQYHARHRKTK